MIYEPSDDSYLLRDVLIKFLDDKNKKIKIIDIGSGSGIQAETCINLNFKNIIATDINNEVIDSLTKKSINCVKSNLFNKINGKFNLIIFNPPYLPEDHREPEDSRLQTTGGKKGYEIINKFLKQSLNHLENNGSIILLFSSLSNPKFILKKAKSLGYNFNLLDKKKISFEELYVYEFNRR